MKKAMVSWVVVGALLLLVMGSMAGCGKNAEPLDPEARKLVVIGWDSADWRLLKPMMDDEGRLPVLKNFMTQSAHGRMKTFFPLEKSPVLWPACG